MFRIGIGSDRTSPIAGVQLYVDTLNVKYTMGTRSCSLGLEQSRRCVGSSCQCDQRGECVGVFVEPRVERER